MLRGVEKNCAAEGNFSDARISAVKQAKRRICDYRWQTTATEKCKRVIASRMKWGFFWDEVNNRGFATGGGNRKAVMLNAVPPRVSAVTSLLDGQYYFRPNSFRTRSTNRRSKSLS